MGISGTELHLQGYFSGFEKSTSRSYASPVKHLSLLFLLVLGWCILPPKASAQQAKGIFFSVFGADASADLGDFNKMQAIYFDVPVDEDRPVYLRIFDADVGGSYEERQDNFNTQTRFLLLGGSSATKVFGASMDPLHEDPVFQNEDIIYDRTYGVEPRLNARYLNLGELPKEKGYLTDDGYRRYVLIVRGIKGNDSNYFDLLLSYDPNGKDIPSVTRTFTYDLSIRIPDQPDFIGQIPLDPGNHDQVKLSTFDLDGATIFLEQPFQSNDTLKTSGDGEWITNEVPVTNPENIAYLNFTFRGRDFNNSFALMMQAPDGTPLPIDLPIPNYEPVESPRFTYQHTLSPQECGKFNFSAEMVQQGNFEADTVRWLINADTLYGFNPQYQIAEPGTYPYKLEISGVYRGVRTSIDFEDSVRVNTPPTAWNGGDRVHIPQKPIAFDGTVSEDPDGRITGYFWQFGDGNSGKGARIDHTYSSPGKYDLVLRVTDNSNSPCNADTHKSTVKINRPPVAEISAPDYVQIGEIFTLDASRSQDTDGQIVDYTWEIGQDTMLNGKMIQYAFDSRGSWPVRLMVKDDSDVENSTAEAKTVIRINRKPVASAGADIMASPGRPVQLSASNSYDPDGEIRKIEWIVDGVTIEGAKPRVTFDEPGEHKVYLQVRDNSQKGMGRDSLIVRVNYPPEPVIRGEEKYTRGIVELSADDSYDEDGYITEYTWEMGDGTRYTSSNVRHIYEETGTYDVELTVRDNSGTYSSVQKEKKTIVINSLPEAEFNITKLVAPGETITFDGSASTDKDGFITNYYWDFGDGNSAKGVEATHSYDAPGTYQVQLQVQDDSGMEGATGYAYAEVRVNASPKIVARTPDISSPDEPLTIDAGESYDPDGEIEQYRWYINGEWEQGDATYRVKNPGELTSEVILAVIDNSDASNSRSEQVIPLKFNSSPVANAGEDIRTHRKNVLFNGSSSTDPDNDDLRYYWDFGDGGSAEGPVVSHTYNYGGSYKAVLTVDDQRGLENSYAYDTVNVFINRPPEAYFELPYNVCVKDTFRYDGSKSFDIDGSELAYRWAFGDGGRASKPTGYYSYNNTGNFQAILTVDDQEGMPNSTNRFSQRINVVGSPEAEAGEDIVACVDEPVPFDASETSTHGGTINQYLWDFGDGLTSSGMATSHRFAEPGEYTVELTVIGNNYGECPNTDRDQLTVTILPKPVADFNLPRTVIIGDEITLDATPSLKQSGSISAFEWEIGNRETIRWTLQSRTDSLGRLHKEWYMNSDNPTVKERVVPERKLAGTLPVVTRELSRGDYTVKLTIESDNRQGCSKAVETQYVSVREKPELTLEDFPVLAPGDDYEFRVVSNNSNINEIQNSVWKFGDGTSKKGLFVQHSYKEPGTYNVRFQALSPYDTSRTLREISREITVNAPPEPVISGPLRVSPGSTAEFSATESTDPDGEITKYKWFITNGKTAEGPEVSHFFDEPGRYSVSLTVIDDEGAGNSAKSATRTVWVREAPELTLKLPTVVCPGSPVDMIEGLSVQPQDSSVVSIYIGNNKIGYSEARSRSFTFPGMYTLRVELEDGNEQQNVVRQSIKVNGAPKIYADVPQKITIGGANDQALFDASSTFDPNGDVVNIYWDFGDGTEKAGKTVRHRYDEPGTYKVVLTAMDNQEMTCSISRKEYTVEVTRR